MKTRKETSSRARTDDENLYSEYQVLKPRFGDSDEGRLHYLQEMESIASRYNSTVENLVTFIDKKNVWSEEDRRFMRLARLVAALR